MPIFHAIAAMSENRVIGDKGMIPWHLPEDYRWFKHRTMGGTLIMGRKTFAGIGKPLPGRETVVLSRTTATLGVTTCADLLSLDATLATRPAPYWICGGTEVYRQFLGKCDVLYLTRVKRTMPGDTFFPPYEDTFELDQTIHENNQFRVERWVNKIVANRSKLPPESWPFPKAGDSR